MDYDPAMLGQIVNRQMIWDCLLRYIRGVDRMDQDLVRSAFWPDAHNTHGPVSGTVEDFIAGWLPGQEVRDISFHMVSNQSVEFESPTLAHSEAYLIAGLLPKDGGQMELFGGRYADRYECRSGEWRIITRVLMLEWQGLMDSTQMKARLARRHRGSRDADDPTYERPLSPRPAIGGNGWDV